MTVHDTDTFIPELQMFASDVSKLFDVEHTMTCALEEINRIEGEPKSKEIALRALNAFAMDLGFYDHEHLQDHRKIILGRN